MQNTDEQIRKMLELKETIIEKMSKYQDEIDFLQKNLDILDVVLKGSSFTKASILAKKNTEHEKSNILDKHERKSMVLYHCRGRNRDSAITQWKF